MDSCPYVDMMNLELLDLSGNTFMETLPEMSSARSLKVLVLDSCSSLENIAPGEAPQLLESFSFDGYGQANNWTHSIQLPEKELRPNSRSNPVEAKVTKISLEGCARLHSIFLRGLPNLEELDLSGTSIDRLDLNAMDVPRLKKLFLISCKQLRTLTWYGTPELNVLYVDTRGNMRRPMLFCCGEQGRSYDFKACISFIDWWLPGGFTVRIYKRIDRDGNKNNKVHLHASSCAIRSQVSISACIDQEEVGPSQEGPYNDIVLTKDITCSPLVWNHQQLHLLDQHIEIGKGSYNEISVLDPQLVELYMINVKSLHVHDNSSITTIPTSIAYWCSLEWCHIDKCPKLHTPFKASEDEDGFENLKTVSASHLLMAGCIWGKGINNQKRDIIFFKSLQHIYMHNCPRLVFVLPISFTLPNLETLQISYCQNLQHVFPLDDEYPAEIASGGVTFKNLKRIKLYHLHKLEQICEAKLTAPALDTIILRDCWGLRRLPAVSHQFPKPMVDCEKNLWDKLEWDGLEAGHDPLLFETRHSGYYKKTIPRGSLLR